MPGRLMGGRVVVLGAALAMAGCRAPAQVHKDDAFTAAVEASIAHRPERSASAAWDFLAVTDSDDPRYDRALRLLAQSTEELDLSYAAGSTYRQIAQARRNMELVPEALRGLRRIAESGVADDEVLLTGFIASEEFGYLPDDVAAFVDYHRGLDLARRGEDAWADVHFERIPSDSPYSARGEYVRAVRSVADGDYLGAISRLEAVLDRPELGADVEGDVRRTLARLAFEEERFDAALVHLEALREQAPDDPEILLEMAWTQFYLGDSRKALGLLLALDAPIHQTYISPERYLLEALALRRLCQFGAARTAAVRLRDKHGGALDDLRAGALPREVPALLAAARQRGASRRDSRYTDRLAWEAEHVAEVAISDSLKAHLDDLYARGLAEARRREQERIGVELDRLTEELLGADEGVRLIVHELGVSLLRGRRRPAGVAEKPAVDVPLTGERVFYAFEGEFWTDELDDFVVIAEDRCID